LTLTDLVSTVSAMPPAVRQIVARNIRHLRRRDGLTHAELAKKLGVSERAVYRWAKGEASRPSDENLQRLAKAFGVTAGWLLEDHRETRNA
jgi:transcriptional regulator with XRE-family HTH domain